MEEKRREIKKHKTKARTDVKIQQRETRMFTSAEEAINKRWKTLKEQISGKNKGEIKYRRT
jgi:hypothetical protein